MNKAEMKDAVCLVYDEGEGNYNNPYPQDERREVWFDSIESAVEWMQRFSEEKFATALIFDASGDILTEW